MPNDASCAQTAAISASPAEYRFSAPFPRACERARTPRARAASCGVAPERSTSSRALSSSSAPGQPGRAPPAARLAGGRRGQLLPDHAQRQELVPLEAQDRPQALDGVLVEEPVAAPRPLRREQALLLEVADLRDRDVRETRRAGAGRPPRCAGGRSASMSAAAALTRGRSACTCRSAARRRPRAGRTRCAGG